MSHVAWAMICAVLSVQLFTHPRALLSVGILVITREWAQTAGLGLKELPRVQERGNV